MKIQDDSFYIEDECEIDELPSFKIPKNLAISGTGKKVNTAYKIKDSSVHPFASYQRSRMI